MSYNVFIYDDPSSYSRKIYVREEKVGMGTRYALMETPTFKEYTFGERVDPSFEETDIHGRTSLLQAFLDAAWEYGLRPKGYQDFTNELTATKYHLEDMRKLAKVK